MSDGEDLGELSAEDRASLERLKGREAEMLRRTIEWAGVNTGSWNATGLAEFAPRLADAFGALDAEIQLKPIGPIARVGAGGAEEFFETGPIVFGAARPQAPVQIILTGHYDTVFAPGAFDVVDAISDGRVRGPGVIDMKGGLVVMLEALQAFEATGLKNKLGYRLVISPDEEIGNPASAEVIEACARAAHVGLTFEPALENGALAGARMGAARFDAVFHGRSAHVGRAPRDGRSAMFAAAAFVGEIEKLNDADAGVTVNVGKIEGGGEVNLVADTAVVRVGARAASAQMARVAEAGLRAAFERVLQRDGIRGALGGGFHRGPKPRNLAQDLLFSAIQETGAAMALSLDVADTGGACEGNNIFAAGTPSVDTLGPRGGRIHSNEEFLIVESLVERASLTALILNRLADGRLDARALKGIMGQQHERA